MSAAATEPVQRYFIPPVPAFWRWSGQGFAEIETGWESGSLLVFRDELSQLLAGLQPAGWPPLSALLLVMAATRESWPMVRDRLRAMFETASPNNPFVADVIEQLDRLHALPIDLRDSLPARARLLGVVFEGARPALDPASAAEALSLLMTVMPHLHPDAWETTPRASPPRFADWTRSLRIGLARLSEESLRNRQLTGLDDTVVPAPVSVPPPLPVPEPPKTHAARLWEWSHDPQLYGVAKIARQLISVVSWPRRLSQPNDLPLGGVSDLTNRGPLDRLLLSELAQDDDALMVRIALNEALYIRRECPRQESAHYRTILVDAGLRMWGRPRVFGAAVALAMAAAQDKELELTVDVSVTSHAEWQSVDITTRNGALELLGSLSPKLHPGDCLEAWRAANDEDNTDREYVLVTTPDVLRQPDFQQQLTLLPVDFRIALVDGSGRFELRTHSSHGWKTELTAVLDLDELLKPPEVTRRLPLSTGEPDRTPAILRQQVFPLLLTHQLEPGYCFPVGDDKMVTLASGGRVLLWTQPQRGGRQLAANVPRGKVETWANLNTDSGYSSLTVAVLRGPRWTVLSIHPENRTCETVTLTTNWSPTDPTVRAVILPECVVLISKRGMAAFSLTTGEMLHQTSEYQLHLGFHGNRYLYCPGDHWHRLSFDGELRAERIPTGKNLLMLVDPPETYSLDRPIEVPSEGVLAPGTHRVPPFQGNDFALAEQCGDLVLVSGRFEMLNNKHAYNYLSCAIWDMNHSGSGWNRVYHGSQHELALLHQISSKFKTRPALRTKIAGIMCDGSMVCLVSTKQKWWRLHLAGDNLKLVAQTTSADPKPTSSFERQRAMGTAMVQHSTRLANGNTVWLDGRGLLHLLPADLEAPEITLVLDENAITGWVTDGRQFGDSYYLTNFLGGGEQLSVTAAWQTLIAPFFGIVP